MKPDKSSRIFISYAYEDKQKAEALYRDLKIRGFDVWLDSKDLGLGEWKPQIIKAISQSRYFLICISEAALRKTGNKPGFQDKELETAYHIAQSQSREAFVIVPVRLEDCDRGDHRISIFQQYDLFEDWDSGVNRLSKGLGGSQNSTHHKVDEVLASVWVSIYRRDFAAALLQLKPLLSLHAHYENVWVTQGHVMMAQNKYKEARVAFQKAIDIQPNDAKAWNNLGYSLVEQGQYEEACKVFRKAIELAPADAKVWNNLGNSLTSQNHYKEAIEAFREAIRITPHVAEFWYNLGHAHDEDRQYEAAIDAYKKAVDLKPDLASAWYNLGYSLAKDRQFEAAIDAYQKAADLRPDHVNTWHSIAYALHRLGRNEEALVAIERALGFNPEDKRFWHKKGQILQDLGQSNEAEPAFAKAQELG